jgi:hypothetical protein
VARSLDSLASRTLFFIGGPPRSGTTWLQQMLDAHPDVRCRGEGLFLHHFAVPLERLAAERASVIDGKNRDLFSHTGGFPNLSADDLEHLTATAILLGLARCDIGPDCRAIGEKTPENVFFYPRLQTMFPNARFIAIVRDPRDTLSSAWHLFAKAQGQDLLDFVRAALPSMRAGALATLDFARAHPAATRIVTYEALRANPAPVLAVLFAHLDVACDAATIGPVVAATEFSTATGGREAGVTAEGAFHRRGIIGDWRETLTRQAEFEIMQSLGWSFAEFGWVE